MSARRLGQSYIVDAFMTVVVGGVGNIIGTVISALGIGVIDQSLQQILLNPVLGKILVLGGSSSSSNGGRRASSSPRAAASKANECR